MVGDVVVPAAGAVVLVDGGVTVEGAVVLVDGGVAAGVPGVFVSAVDGGASKPGSPPASVGGVVD